MNYTKTEEIITQTKTRSKTFKTLLDWQGNDFESSSGRTPEFMAFAKMFKSYVTKKASLNNLRLVNFNIGHFYLSGFFLNPRSNKYVYFSTSDCRGLNDSWCNHVLIRTASHDKDYTGGSNQYCYITGIGEMALELTKEI